MSVVGGIAQRLSASELIADAEEEVLEEIQEEHRRAQ